MVYSSERLGLSIKAREALRISRHCFRQHLDGDLPVEVRVRRPVHLPHPAYADLGGDLIGAEAGVVTAGQCWHWFDGRQAALECARVLKPNGFVVIAHFDWLPIPEGVVEATEHLIVRHNPDWHFGGGNGFHPEGLADLDAAQFTNCEAFSYEVDVPYTPEAWRGRIRASAGVGASLTAEGVHAFDADLQRLLESSFPFPILQVPHRVYAIPPLACWMRLSPPPTGIRVVIRPWVPVARAPDGVSEDVGAVGA